MPESKDRKPWSEPEHRKNAEQLRSYANGELARKLPLMRLLWDWIMIVVW